MLRYLSSWCNEKYDNKVIIKDDNLRDLKSSKCCTDRTFKSNDMVLKPIVKKCLKIKIWETTIVFQNEPE